HRLRALGAGQATRRRAGTCLDAARDCRRHALDLVVHDTLLIARSTRVTTVAPATLASSHFPFSASPPPLRRPPGARARCVARRCSPPRPCPPGQRARGTARACAPRSRPRAKPGPPDRPAAAGGPRQD